MTVGESSTDLQGVSVVIPNWNGAQLLSANLPHVLAICKEYPGQSEIILVDDASDDGSVPLLREKFAATVRLRFLVEMELSLP